MRVYHLLKEEWALEGLRLRRLKLSRLEDMNDPFELLGADLRNRKERRFFQKLKAAVHKELGILCFSKNWSNPVLWSHYGDRHRGICLGFDIPDEWARKVNYRGSRIQADVARRLTDASEEELTQQLIATKYEHWRYEEEVRMFLRLQDVQVDKGHYFLPFCDALQLREVITGARFSSTKAAIRELLSEQERGVKIIKGRLAFRSFKVVENKAASSI